jgi:predicted PhzF superfamily epimerase YddE/YHI9
MARRRFNQVDVFTSTPYLGNPVAVVLDGEGLDTAEMQRFARWTNLSETTFVLPPTEPEADYRVRIFTSASGTDGRAEPPAELPFAGHPTLGTCHAWLTASARANGDRVTVQECGAGLVDVRPTTVGLAFAAPPLLRSGPVDEALVEHIAEVSSDRPRGDRRRRLGRQRPRMGRRAARNRRRRVVAAPRLRRP